MGVFTSPILMCKLWQGGRAMRPVGDSGVLEWWAMLGPAAASGGDDLSHG